MPEPISFDIAHDSSSLESEMLVQIRAHAHPNGHRIVLSFHMTEDEFTKFAYDGHEFFEHKSVLDTHTEPAWIQVMRDNGWTVDPDGFIYHDSAGQRYGDWESALQACIEVASNN